MLSPTGSLVSSKRGTFTRGLCGALKSGRERQEFLAAFRATYSFSFLILYVWFFFARYVWKAPGNVPLFLKQFF